jgi:hypothetical protein
MNSVNFVYYAAAMQLFHFLEAARGGVNANNATMSSRRSCSDISGDAEFKCQP